MSIEPKVSTPATNKVLKSVDVFNDIDNQEIRKIVKQKGFYIRGAVESFQDEEGKAVDYAFCQMLIKSREDSVKMEVMNIKVREEQRGLIDLLNQMPFKFLTLDLEIAQFGKQTNFYLCSDQSALTLKAS